MRPYPHRIETPAGVRYGTPVEVSEARVTYEMVPIDEATFRRVIEENAAEFHRAVRAAEPNLPDPPSAA